MNEPKKHVEPIHEQFVNEFEHSCRTWNARAKVGTTIEDVLDPNYWRHCAWRLNPLEEIRIISDDMQWYARLLVTSVIKGAVVGQIPQASMMILQYKDLAKAAMSRPKESDYEVKFQSPEMKYCIFHKKSGDIVESGFETEVLAAESLKRFLANMGGKAAA